MGQSPIATGQPGFGEQFPGGRFHGEMGSRSSLLGEDTGLGFFGGIPGLAPGCVLGFDAVVLRKQIKGHF